jgi:hypothetical protein
MRIGGRLFGRRSSKRSARLRGVALALAGFCALAFVVSAATHQKAMAATERSALSRIDGAFSTLPTVIPRETESSPQVPQVDCSDFAVAFINAKCSKVWRRHASVKRHHVATIQSAMVSRRE